MSDAEKGPTNAELLTAMQGMWRQQKSLIEGVEKQLGDRLDSGLSKLDATMDASVKRLREEIAQEIHDRPVVVHVDMGRVSDLEKQVADLSRRLTELEERTRT
jgi:hypothetical protein